MLLPIHRITREGQADFITLQTFYAEDTNIKCQHTEACTYSHTALQCTRECVHSDSDLCRFFCAGGPLERV